MAKTLANCSIWLDTVAVASQINQVTIQASATEEDVTTFANVGMARLGGLKDAIISAAGYWEANPDPDFTIFSDVGGGANGNIPITVGLAQNAPVGTVAYIMGALLAQYGGIGAKVGKPLAFSLRAAQVAGNINGPDNGRLAQGLVAVNGAITASGSSAIQGPVPVPTTAQQAIVAALHVTGMSGGASLLVSLQSAATVGFASPTTRFTFNAVSGVNAAQCVEVPGPITDQYWRFAWTVTGGSSPSFTVAASFGLAS